MQTTQTEKVQMGHAVNKENLGRCEMIQYFLTKNQHLKTLL